MKQKIRLLDTFAGVGGFHKALQESIGKENIDCIGFSEIDKYAKLVYQNHFPESKDLGDITKIDIKNLPDFDLLTGGFPCQDISVAGKQDLSRGRSALVEYLLQILEEKQPRYFVFENVKNLLGKKFETFFSSIIERAENAGYSIKYQVLNTKDFGLPQNRQRVFIVGELNDYLGDFDFPEGEELTKKLNDFIEKDVGDEYFLTPKQLERLKFSKMEDEKNIILGNKQSDKKNVKLKDFSTFSQDNTFIGTNDIVPTLTAGDGGNRPKVYGTVKIVNATKKGFLEGKEGDGVSLDYLGSKTKRGRVKDGISGTLTCIGIDGVITKDLGIRRLTPVECARLQGFPDKRSTEFVSNSQAYKQAGNAISVPVVKALFDNLFFYEKNNKG